MEAYATKLDNKWYGFIRALNGSWVPIAGWHPTKEDCESYLVGQGFTVKPCN